MNRPQQFTQTPVHQILPKGSFIIQIEPQTIR